MKKMLAPGIMLFLASFAISTLCAENLKVSMPNGAPAICLSDLAKKKPNDFTFSFVAAETIPAEFARADADFIIAPINAGARLFKNGKSTYRLAAVVTWGNLHFASQKKFSLKDIKKRGVTLFGEGTINSSVALAALEKSGIKPKKIEFLAGAANTQSLLLSDKKAIVLTAEPALSAAKAKKSITSFSVNELLEKNANMQGFAQAGLFVKADTILNRSEEVQSFLNDAKSSCDACVSNLEEVAKSTVEQKILPNETVAKTAIPGCSIKFVRATNAKAQIEQTAQIDIKQYGGELPKDDFYYAE